MMLTERGQLQCIQRLFLSNTPLTIDVIAPHSSVNASSTAFFSASSVTCHGNVTSIGQITSIHHPSPHIECNHLTCERRRVIKKTPKQQSTNLERIRLSSVDWTIDGTWQPLQSWAMLLIVKLHSCYLIRSQQLLIICGQWRLDMLTSSSSSRLFMAIRSHHCERTGWAVEHDSQGAAAEVRVEPVMVKEVERMAQAQSYHWSCRHTTPAPGSFALFLRVMADQSDLRANEHATSNAKGLLGEMANRPKEGSFL